MNRNYTVNFKRDSFTDSPGQIETEFHVTEISIDRALIRCLESCLISGYRNVRILNVVTHFSDEW